MASKQNIDESTQFMCDDRRASELKKKQKIKLK